MPFAPADRTRAFRTALRHSRRVRLLRVALPVLLVAASAGFGLYRWLDPVGVFNKLPVSVDSMAISGTKIVMRQPRLSGYTKDERHYTVTARSAAQDLTDPDVVELEEIKTTLGLQNGNLEVTARHGLYNSKADTIRLRDDIVVSSADFEILLRDALINVRGGSVASEQPVEVRMMQGKLNANRLEVTESGELVRFDGGVTLVIDSAAADVRNQALLPKAAGATP